MKNLSSAVVIRFLIPDTSMHLCLCFFVNILDAGASDLDLKELVFNLINFLIPYFMLWLRVLLAFSREQNLQSYAI